MYKKVISLFACLMLLAGIVSHTACKKKISTTVTNEQGNNDSSNNPNDNDSNQQQTNYKIFVTGKTFPGETLKLSSNIPEDIPITWAITYPGRTVYYENRNAEMILKETGKHSISIIVDGDQSNIKGNNPSTSFTVRNRYNPDDIKKMAGSRVWDVVVDSGRHMVQHMRDTIEVYKDTFSVTIVSELLIMLKGEKIPAEASSVQFGVLDHYTFERKNSPYHWERVTYYHKADSIVYSSHADIGGRQTGKAEFQVYGPTTTYYSRK